jgi:hypothetical protein
VASTGSVWRRLGVLVAIGLFGAGGYGLGKTIRYRHPRALTCAQAATPLAPGEWISLTGCSVSVLEAVQRAGHDDEALLPLIPSAPPATLVRLVLATRDPEILAVMHDVQKSRARGPIDLVEFLMENSNEARVFRNRDVIGRVEPPVDKDDKVRGRLHHFNKALAEDFVLIGEIAEGRAPGLGGPVVLLVAGIGVGGALFTRRRRRVPAAAS